jgi:hypothetical protein
MTDYRTMFSGMAALQAAAATTAAAIMVRAFDVALREGARVTQALFAVQPAARGTGAGMQEIPMLHLAASYGECVRGFAALPRVSALVFLGELDRIRGPRAVPGKAGAAGADGAPR